MPRKLVRKELEPEEEEPEPLLYSVEAAARILGGISTNMVYKYIQFGQLRPIKLGSRTLLSMEELQRFVRERQADSETG